MDLAKIGKFIQSCRKENKMTQVQLAIKIGVSEKTISKWECGNGCPDATLMLPLCNALGITANELLSGKRLNDDKNYKEVAEDNIIKLKQEQERSTKFLLTLEIVVGIFSLIIFFTFIGIASFVYLPEIWRVVLIVIGFCLMLLGFHFCMIIEKDAGFYKCKHCNHKYVPTLKQIYVSMHMGRTRYMKCPKCHNKSWQRKTINKD